MSNITLIGMPGSGKSTVGVLLAKTLGRGFLDTDLVIQQQENALLQDILDRRGVTYFLDAEERAVRSVRCDHYVIAPGGSVIYGKEAMEHLKDIGVVVYLKLSLEEMAMVIAAPFWSTIDRKPPEEQEKLRYLRKMFSSLLITGPFSPWIQL